eukprot:g73409.t1
MIGWTQPQPRRDYLISATPLPRHHTRLPQPTHFPPLRVKPLVRPESNPNQNMQAHIIPHQPLSQLCQINPPSVQHYPDRLRSTTSRQTESICFVVRSEWHVRPVISLTGL